MICLWQEDRVKRGVAQATLLALVCLLMPAYRLRAQSSPSQEKLALPLANPDFAIADFDGDRKPDLAMVEVERAISAGNTRYSIRLKLTSGNSQVLGVTAPAGGLQIIARDVNGDNALDLLVSTAWEHQQVAVFLNDGHGNFTQAAPGRFSAFLWDYDEHWVSGSVPRGDGAVLLRCQTSPDAGHQQARGKSTVRQVGLAQRFILRNSTRLLLLRLLGRAPPAGVHQA
jgi:hypothetical protein